MPTALPKSPWLPTLVKVGFPIIAMGITCYVLLQTLKEDVKVIKTELPPIKAKLQDHEHEVMRLDFNDKQHTQNFDQLKALMEGQTRNLDRVLQAQQQMQVEVKVIQEILKQNANDTR